LNSLLLIEKGIFAVVENSYLLQHSEKYEQQLLMMVLYKKNMSKDY